MASWPEWRVLYADTDKVKEYPGPDRRQGSRRPLEVERSEHRPARCSAAFGGADQQPYRLWADVHAYNGGSARRMIFGSVSRQLISDSPSLRCRRSESIRAR